MKSVHIGTMAGVMFLTACATSPNYQRPTITTNAQGIPSHHLVRQGDTVSQIAKRYGLNWQEVARINRLDSNHTIYAGQWLKLWQGSGAVNARQSTPSTASSGRVITVKSTKPTVAPVSTPVVSATPSPAVSRAMVNAGGEFVYPVAKTATVVRPFGTVREINGSPVKTEGVWFGAKEGDVVVASQGGTIIYADVNTMPDASVAIRHADGFISEYRFIKDAQVKAGQTVQRGQPIASIKSTNGVAVMEFRIAKNQNYIDPMGLLK